MRTSIPCSRNSPTIHHLASASLVRNRPNANTIDKMSRRYAQRNKNRITGNYQIRAGETTGKASGLAFLDEPLHFAMVQFAGAELGDFLKAIFDDDEKFRVLRELMQNRIYGKLREESETDPPPGNVLPFKRVPLKDVKPFENCIPALDLKVAAGHFTSGEVEPHHLAKTDPGRFDWVSIPGREPRADLFVAQVVGESMNRRIPNGAWCLWKLNPSGSRERKIVLAQHRDISDPEHGGHYTVKVYSSEKVRDEDGSWRHLSVKLSPDSNDESFKPIVLSALSDSSLAIIAELQEVLS